MKSTSIIAVLGLAAAAFALPASAQMRGGYAGLSVGQSDYKFTGCTSPCDTKGRDFRLFGGLQYNNMLAVELGYADMGKSTFGASNLSATAWDLSGVGTWPIAMGFSVLARLGIYNGDLKSTTPSTGAGLKHGKTDLTFGFGVQSEVSRALAARAEWQRYSKMGGGGFNQSGDIDTLTVGMFWRFQ